MKPKPRRDLYNRIHRAILAGLLSNVAAHDERRQYCVAGGGKALLWPGSGLFAKRPAWIVAAEIVETGKRYLRTCARVNTHWIEAVAGHVVEHEYSDPYWDRRLGSAMALEKVSLLQLTLVAGRRVRYGPIDPDESRALLLQHGLVEGKIDLPFDRFLHDNRELIARLEHFQAKLRRNDFLPGTWARFDFYHERVPRHVYDRAGLERWLRKASHENPDVLHMRREDLLDDDPGEPSEADFPDVLALGPAEFPLEYRFEPAGERDGLTLCLPVEAVAHLDRQRFDWLVPGMLPASVAALVRALPKPIRRALVPVPQTVQRVLASIRFGEGDLRQAVARTLSSIAGQLITPADFQLDKLPDHLRMNLCVLGADGQVLAMGRELDDVRRHLNVQVAETFSVLDEPRWNRDGLVGWDFDELPDQIELVRGGLPLRAYPMLVDRQDSVALRLADSADRAARQSRLGLRRLLVLQAGRELRTQVDWLPGLQRMVLLAAPLGGLDLRRQLVELIADRTLPADPPLPRTKAAFDALLESCRQRIPLAVQDVLGLLTPLWEAYHQAHWRWRSREQRNGSTPPTTCAASWPG